jgi:AAA domain-containing protein
LPRQYATLADVARAVKETRWLIRGWLPRGQVSVVFGHPEAGKTGLMIQAARQLLFGEPWPDGVPCEPIKRAVWVDTEAAQGELVTRASLWGLPMDRVAMAAPPEDPMRECQIDSAADLRDLEYAVIDNQVELVVIDSLRGAHAQKEDSQLNAVFHNLQLLARNTDAAVVLLHHARKPDPKDPFRFLTLDDLRGTSTLGASVRVAWAVQRMKPESEGEPPSVVRCVKNSFDSKPGPISFTISDLGFHWSEPPKLTTEEITALQAAKDFLSKLLISGAVLSCEVQSKAKLAGISDKTLWRARRELGVRAFHEAKLGGRWYMGLATLPSWPSSKAVKDGQESMWRRGAA